jgi:hypothetical protein
MADAISWIETHWATLVVAVFAVIGLVSSVLSSLGALLPADRGGDWCKRTGTDLAYLAAWLRRALSGGGAPPAGLVLALALASVPALSGCAGSFELARHGGQAERVTLSAAGVPVTPADRAHCEAIDGRRQVWSALAKGGAALTGGSGLSAIPVDDPGARAAIAAGAVAIGAFTAAAIAVADGAGAEWARECSAP